VGAMKRGLREWRLYRHQPLVALLVLLAVTPAHSMLPNTAMGWIDMWVQAHTAGARHYVIRQLNEVAAAQQLPCFYVGGTSETSEHQELWCRTSEAGPVVISASEVNEENRYAAGFIGASCVVDQSDAVRVLNALDKLNARLRKRPDIGQIDNQRLVEARKRVQEPGFGPGHCWPTSILAR